MIRKNPFIAFWKNWGLEAKYSNIMNPTEGFKQWQSFKKEFFDLCEQEAKNKEYLLPYTSKERNKGYAVGRKQALNLVRGGVFK